jgi:hypothetical protein
MSGWITHKFQCPSCDEAGEIKLPVSFERFDCPADCGASFVHYEERHGKWRINCVMPIRLTPTEANGSVSFIGASAFTQEENMRPLEPLLPGETRSEYLARVDRIENEAWADWFGRAQTFDGVEEAFRAGFRAARRIIQHPDAADTAHPNCVVRPVFEDEPSQSCGAARATQERGE